MLGLRACTAGFFHNLQEDAADQGGGFSWLSRFLKLTILTFPETVFLELQ